MHQALDLAAGAAGLVATLPFYPAIASAIYQDNPGPIFYFQPRSRAEGMVIEEFLMYKFRSMGVNAEANGQAVIAGQNDARVTQVGRFIRKTRIDELPQFINLLLGQMSLIGPRPERMAFLAQMAEAIPHFEQRTFEGRPGITGLAQVSLDYEGRPIPGTQMHEVFTRNVADPANPTTADSFRFKLLHDLAYRAAQEDPRRALLADLYIIVRTVRVMTGGFGR